EPVRLDPGVPEQRVLLRQLLHLLLAPPRELLLEAGQGGEHLQVLVLDDPAVDLRRVDLTLEVLTPLERVAGVDQRPVLGHRLLSQRLVRLEDRKSTRLNSSHVKISYAVFCLKQKMENN